LMPRKSSAVTAAPNKQTKENEDAYLSIVICGCLGCIRSASYSRFMKSNQKS
jgi:hypothetical protein